MTTSKFKKLNLAAYSLMAGSFLLTKENSNAQIIYTDVDPDIILDAGIFEQRSYNLDFDADGINELRIVDEGWTNSYTGAYSAYILGRVKEEDRITAYSTYFYEAAKALHYGQLISKGEVPFMRFAAAGKRDVCLGADWGWGGPSGFMFDGGAHGYVGVYLKLGDGLSHYGWIEITTGENGDFVKIHSFAYENQPKVPIKAGQTGELRQASGNDINESNVLVYPTLCSDGKLNLQFKSSESNETEIELVNEVGLVVYRKSVHAPLGTTHHQLDINLFPNGIYFLRMKRADGLVTRRIILQQ